MDLEQGSSAWHAARREKLTASNFAAATGLNPFKSRARLWTEMSGIAQESDFCNEAMQHGRDYEAFAIKVYEALNSVQVHRTGLHEHPTIPYLAGSPDGLMDDGRLLETKCPFKGEIYAKIPDYYMPQIQGLLDITGRYWADFFCFTPTATKTWVVMRDQTYIDLMHACLAFFWSHVRDGSPPEPYSERMSDDKLSAEQRALREFRRYALD